MAFISDKTAPFYLGGYEVRVFELAKSLAESFDVQILSSAIDVEHIGAHVHFQKVFSRAFQKFPTGSRSMLNTCVVGCTSWFLANRLRDFDTVIVEAIPYIHLPALARARRRLGFRLIIDVSEAWGEFVEPGHAFAKARHAVIRALLMQGLRHADAVIAVSRATEASLIHNYGVSSKSLRVIPNGIPKQQIVADVRVFGERTIDVTVVARLVANKRVEDLIKALSKLKSSHGWNGQAAIIGDGPCRTQLEELVKDLALGANVKFLGIVPDSVKTAALRDTKVFVLTSEREGFSIASLEAMGQGVPVIASRPPTSDVFGVSEIVRPGETGVYYPTGDFNELASMLWNLWEDVATREEMGRNCISLARHYTWEFATGRLEELIDITNHSSVGVRKSDG